MIRYAWSLVKDKKGQGAVEYLALGGAIMGMLSVVLSQKDSIASIFTNTLKGMLGGLF